MGVEDLARAHPCWHEHYDPCIWRSRATEEQKRVGWETWVRMEKIICTVLEEARKRQLEETMDALSEGPGSFYKSFLDWEDYSEE